MKSSQSELNKVVEEQKQEIAILKSSLEAEISNSKEHSSSKIVTDELRIELSNLNKQHDELKTTAQNLSEKKIELEKKLEKIQSDLDKLNNSNIELEKELKFRFENEEKQSHLMDDLKREKETEHEKFNEKIQSLNQELDNLKHVKTELDLKLEQATLSLSELHKDELNELRKNIHELEKEKTSLISELETKAKAEQASRDDITQLKQEIELLNLAKSDLNEKLQNAYSNLDESHKNQLESLNAQIDELKQNCQRILEEKTHLEKQFLNEKETMNKKIDEVTNEWQSLKSNKCFLFKQKEKESFKI